MLNERVYVGREQRNEGPDSVLKYFGDCSVMVHAPDNIDNLPASDKFRAVHLHY
jgi:hypothetical protein